MMIEYKNLQGKVFMYRKDSEEWLKHMDFIILDLICLQLSYVLAYAGSGYGFNLYGTMIYRNMAVFLELADLVVIFIYGTMKNVLKRRRYQELRITVNHVVMVMALTILYLFLIQQRAGSIQTGDDPYRYLLCPADLCSQRTLEMYALQKNGGWWRSETADHHF